MIATYIQELLATNNRVIVPNYGAFLVRATSKSKDANTLEEKLKDIYFSPFLKFNDELLEKHIIKNENITKEQAAEKIVKFIDGIKKELDQEKTYDIKGFGQFVSDKQGKVQFVTVYKEENTKTPKEEPKATKTATKKTAAKKTTATKDKAKTEEVKSDKIEVKKEEIKKEPEVKKETKLQEFEPENKDVKKEISTPITSSPAPEKKPIYNYKKEKKPINKGLVWSIAIGLPVAAIFIWGVLNFSTVKKVFTKEKVKTEKVAKKTKSTKKATTKKKTTNSTSSDQTKTKTEAKATTAKPEAKKPVKEATTKPVVNQKKYYIIAGSFKNEKYAISYLNKLKTEGYNAEKLAERDGMHAVSYNSFVDKRKAIAEYKFLSQEKELQAWILYF
ncbi:MAG: SPOR domain-containing protein [Bacteroidales bacterium]|nr:SPOR domain-containing protein [Bacteroidales bacterium]